MNGDPIGRVEQFNQAIRGIVVLAFTGAICYGFVVSKVLSTETMVILANTVFIWWFKSRDDDKKAAAAQPPQNGTTSTSTTTTATSTATPPEEKKT